MKITFIFLSLFALSIKSSFGLECMGCEITDTSSKCESWSKCKKGIEMCETTVSKVGGNYTITMSCATKDKCGLDSVFQEGLEECMHKE